MMLPEGFFFYSLDYYKLFRGQNLGEFSFLFKPFFLCTLALTKHICAPFFVSNLLNGTEWMKPLLRPKNGDLIPHVQRILDKRGRSTVKVA